MNAALGIKPTTNRHSESGAATHHLDADEMKQLLARGTIRDANSINDNTGAASDTFHSMDRIEGLGAAPARTHDHIPKPLTSVQKEIAALKQQQREKTASTSNSDCKKNESLASSASNVAGGNSMSSGGAGNKISHEVQDSDGADSDGSRSNKRHRHSKHEHTHKSGSNKDSKHHHKKHSKHHHHHRHHHHGDDIKKRKRSVS